MSSSQKREKETLWSYSRTACFTNCKYEYYLNYIIDDDDLYLSEGNYYAEVGSFVHEILALIFKGELKPEDALTYYLDNYDNFVCYKARQATMDKTYETIADYFTNLNIEWIKKYEILGVELKMQFVVNNHKFVGFIDLLLRDKTDGRIVVLDHKSSAYPFGKTNGKVKKSSQKSFDTYKKQMYLYCHAVYQTYGEFPKEITWNHFKDGGIFATIPFKEDEYAETIKWFSDIIQTIEFEKEFEPTQNYFYCSNLCNFRASCEYNNE